MPPHLVKKQLFRLSPDDTGSEFNQRLNLFASLRVFRSTDCEHSETHGDTDEYGRICELLAWANPKVIFQSPPKS